MPVEIDYPRVTNGARFRIGKLFATPGVLNSILSDDIMIGLARHQRCDWGDIEEKVRKINERALVRGHRLFSAYRSGSGARFLIITQASRRVTNLLLPSEY